jgi:hypothetical protein
MSTKSSFCWGCGAKLKLNQKFCTSCGKPVKFKKEPNKASASPTNNYGRQADNQKPYKTKRDLASAYSSISNQKSNVISTPKREKAAPVAPVAPVTPIAPTPAISPEDIKKITELKETIEGLGLEKRFKAIEYKINALNVENQMLDIENKVDDLRLKYKPYEPVKIPENLAKAEDIEALHAKIDNINLEKLATAEDMDTLHTKIDNINLDVLDDRLKDLDKKMGSLDSAEKLSNLAQNTVNRLNKIENRLNEFNLETRKRVSQMDEKIDGMGGQLNHITEAVNAMVPSLVKLTEKINELTKKVTVQQIRVEKQSAKETVQPKTKSLDLPPFPIAEKQGKKKSTSEKKTSLEPST